MGRLIVLLLLTFALISQYEAAKVLVVFPFPGKSHGILGDGFVRVLADAGHEVTYITPFPKKNTPKNVRELNVSENLELPLSNRLNITAILEGEIDLTDMSEFFPLLARLGKNTFNNVNVQEILNNQSEQFDVIILEYMFNEMSIGLSAVFNCPFIWFSSLEAHTFALRLIDEPLNPSYNPNPFKEGVPPFSFVDRVQRLLQQTFVTFMMEYYSTPKDTKLYEEIFVPILEKRGRKLPPFEEVRYNSSIMLGNSHVSLGQPTRLPQNYKPIGGYHINPDIQPLPKDLKIVMDSAKHGVIYFSMGSNLKSKDLPDIIKKDLVQMFGAMKYTILWKFEESFPDLPKNVHIIKWAPQPSILSHPNCILFITHGGLLSTTEAVHFGVPIIGIPVFADQFMNVERAENKGFAKHIKFTYSLVNDLKDAIGEMIGNHKYLEKAKELSMIYHDRPVPPGAELMHWVEHVVRTRGAPHLRSPALDIPFYQKAYLDFVLVVIVLLYLIVNVLKTVCCRRKKNNEKKKRN